MKTLLVAVAIVVAVPAIGQEIKHAPTAAQCQADQAVWLSQVNNPSSTGWAETVKDTSETLAAWAEEMNTCSTVDPSNQVKYNRTTDLIFLVMYARETDFLIRHGLLRQFFDEDKAGKR